MVEKYKYALNFQVRLAATSCVTRDIKEAGDYGGFPAVSIIVKMKEKKMLSS